MTPSPRNDSKPLVWSLECQNPTCRYVVITIEEAALRFGCPHCRSAVWSTRAASIKRLRREFRSRHQAPPDDAKRRFDDAIVRHREVLAAKASVAADEARQLERRRRFVALPNRVASICEHCGWVAIFRLAADKLSSRRNTAPRVCRQCEHQSVVHVPATGAAAYEAALVILVRDYARARGLGEAQLEALFLACSHALRRLAAHDAVLIQPAATGEATKVSGPAIAARRRKTRQAVARMRAAPRKQRMHD